MGSGVEGLLILSSRIRNRTGKCSGWLEALQYLLITEQELVV